MSVTTHQQQTQEGSWATINAALEAAVGPGKPAAEWVRYCCPVHEGDGRRHRPSLAVKYDAAAHRTVVRCFAGCDNELVLEKVGLQVRDMFDTRLDRDPARARATRPRPRPLSRADRAIDAAGLPLTKPKKDLGKQVSSWKPTAVYPYARADGTVAGEVVRLEADFERGRDKDFRQRHWTEKGMRSGGFEPIPFQLPRVLDAVAQGRTIFVVEGEKDVLAAESAGLTATCNAGGASNWNAEHARWLAGAAVVVIVADRDAPGYRRAEKVLDSLSGSVGRVRIVQAATGKDLSDHLNLGHEVRELEPVPWLDPHTRTPPPPAPTRETRTEAAETDPVSAAVSEPHPEHGGTTMGEQLLAPQLHDHAADTTPDIDHAGQQWAMFTRLLMNQMLLSAQRAVEERKRRMEVQAAAAEDEQRAHAARLEAEQRAVDARLRKLAEAGWINAPRAEIAAAVRDAATWAPQSAIAKSALAELTTHVHTRFGLRLDESTGQVSVDVPPDLAQALVSAETERAGGDRRRKAQDRMVELVAAEQSLDESAKQALYADIEAWRANPSARQLDQLSKKLADKGVVERTRVQVRFIASYLGTPGQLVPIDELGATTSVSPTVELRRMTAPLVDLGEVAKPRVDELLNSYQARLRHGEDVTWVTEQLTEAVKVMTPEDQETARQRGRAIRANPAADQKPLWPNHVDRVALAESVHAYAAITRQADRQAVAADDLDASAPAHLRERAAVYRRRIDHALRDGEGLHRLEKDQLAHVVRDIDSGVERVPELLFADDASAAVVDADRSDQIAADTSRVHRRQLDQILTSSAAPERVLRDTRDAVSKVFDSQTQLAAGRWNLPDYEQRGGAAALATGLAAAGAPEPVRNQVRNHLDYAAGEAAIAGKQARRIANQYVERRESVAAARTPAKPSYDSPERRTAYADTLRAAGLSEDVVNQRVAADAGRAVPPSEATATKPGKGGAARTTTPGAGVRRAYGRGRGDQRGRGI